MKTEKKLPKSKTIVILMESQVEKLITNLIKPIQE